MTFLLILSALILLFGAGAFVWAMATWLRVVEEGKRAKPLPKKSEP